jgi:hypothetical protein
MCGVNCYWTLISQVGKALRPDRIESTSQPPTGQLWRELPGRGERSLRLAFRGSPSMTATLRMACGVSAIIPAIRTSCHAPYELQSYQEGKIESAAISLTISHRSLPKSVRAGTLDAIRRRRLEVSEPAFKVPSREPRMQLLAPAVGLRTVWLLPANPLGL